jgi:alkaline phosphatase
MKSRVKLCLKTAILNLFVSSVLFAASGDRPQNIIFIIVDGGGFNHIDALDYYQYGRRGAAPFKKFPVKLAVTTYPAGGSYDPIKAAEDFNYVKTGFTDSAAAATAMATGIKTSNGEIGVGVNGNRLENIIERCEKLGMATGVVTTAQITDATPASFVAHQQSRKDYQQIADEMINTSGLEVLFGCGNPFFDDDGKKLDVPDPTRKKIWDSYIENSTDKWTLIQSRQEFLNLAQGDTPRRVLGIAQAASTLQEKRKGNSVAPFDVPLNRNVPNLSEMTRAALNVLDDDPDGFFIMIEAGVVDSACHDKTDARLIEEMIDFNNDIKTVVEWVDKKSSWQKTLVIVTADHECGYLTGPDNGRFVINNGKGKLPKMQFNSKGHTNSLVFFYARGKDAKLFEQIAKKDPLHGRCIDNIDIAKVIFSLLEQKVSVRK